MLPYPPWTDKLAACPAFLKNPNPGVSPSIILASHVWFLPLRYWPTDFSRSHITIPLQKACYVVSTIGHGMYQLSTIITYLPRLGPSVPYQSPLYK